MSSRRARRPGRPPSPRSGAGLDVRDRLLREGGRLCRRFGPARVSARQIADAAGVTPAMIHYYFGDKSGLFDAMLGRALGRIVERARELERIDELPGILIGALSEDPWIPQLLVQEVLVEGGPYRDRFIAEYASQMAQIVPGLVQDDIDDGRFRDGLDPRLALLSMLGMIVFPFVARPVLERALDIDFDDAVVGRLAEHTLRIFLEGVEA